MAMQPPLRPADRAVDLSQRSFERKGHASPGGQLWSPECDGSKTNLGSSFEQRCYSVDPSTGASPATVPSSPSTTAPWRASSSNGRSPRSPGTTASTLRSLETSRFTGPPWRVLPAELCPLKPPPASRVKMPPAPSSSPAPSAFPAPQSTYVSPPMIFAQPRPWKPAEQGADGSHAPPSFTLNVYRGICL